MRPMPAPDPLSDKDTYACPSSFVIRPPPAPDPPKLMPISSSVPLQSSQQPLPAPDQHECPMYHKRLGPAVYSTELIV
eukprot:15230440-Ditylum_brightwellii.AAC.1